MKRLAKNKRQAVISIIALGAIASLFFSQFQPGQARTYTFFQTSWSGGTSALRAQHSSNQNGWDKYESKTAKIDAVAVDSSGGTKIQLTTTVDSQSINHNTAAPNGPNGESVAIVNTTINDISPQGQSLSNDENTPIPDLTPAGQSAVGTLTRPPSTVTGQGDTVVATQGNATTPVSGSGDSVKGTELSVPYSQTDSGSFPSLTATLTNV